MPLTVEIGSRYFVLLDKWCCCCRIERDKFMSAIVDVFAHFVYQQIRLLSTIKGCELAIDYDSLVAVNR